MHFHVRSRWRQVPLPVQIVRRDPLFDGLPDEIVVRQAHAFQVMQVPEEMERLASSPECTVQAFKHRRRLVYGTQFHPEIHDDQHPHGGVVVENFFRLVRADFGGNATAGADATSCLLSRAVRATPARRVDPSCTRGG
jgi:gamma-glutamyl-gamma-aminobutyrate hydrolase PuuD